MNLLITRSQLVSLNTARIKMKEHNPKISANLNDLFIILKDKLEEKEDSLKED